MASVAQKLIPVSSADPRRRILPIAVARQTQKHKTVAVASSIHSTATTTQLNESTASRSSAGLSWVIRLKTNESIDQTDQQTRGASTGSHDSQIPCPAPQLHIRRGRTARLALSVEIWLIAAQL